MDMRKGYGEIASQYRVERRINETTVADRRGQAGFTVMEILVVIAVLGILAGIGFYSLNTLRPIMAIRGVSTEINTMIHKARMDAIRNNRVVIGSVETELGGDSPAHNPTGIKNEFLVFKVRDSFGVETEINSYRMFRGFPNIHFWGHDEGVILDSNAITFANDKVVFNSDGTVFGTGAFRIAYARSPVRNTLEIRIPTSAGVPEVRKFLMPGDRPSGASSQEFFIETAASSGNPRALWRWY